ncbi:MAG: hypothetical protein KAT04_04945 [Methylococcales bacterium]|nr:hypothetical protein [Methylococcales bacterium]
MNEINISVTAGLEDDEGSIFADEKIVVTKINKEFKQQDKLKGVERQFTIFNNIYCSQMVNKKHGKKQNFYVNLTYLNVKPQHVFSIAWNCLITTAVFFIVSILFVYLEWFSSADGWFKSLQIDGAIVSVSVSLTVSLCVIFLLMTILRTHDSFFLLSRHGGIPILEFQNNKPEKKSFDLFFDKLKAHIVKAQQISKLEPTRQLTLELKELRRLKDEKMIAEDLYEKAKNTIFSNSAF